MSKNLWDKERDSMFLELTQEYKDEGYSTKQAKRLAKKETQEIIADKLDFVEDVIQKCFEDR
jgi:hypothetical protein|tara:strand:+ start:363 stop:548 length:186 start_codon:yes stop_codon:yes gene_type:complete